MKTQGGNIFVFIALPTPLPLRLSFGDCEDMACENTGAATQPLHWITNKERNCHQANSFTANSV